MESLWRIRGEEVGVRAVGTAIFSKGRACFCLLHQSARNNGSDIEGTNTVGFRNMAAASLMGICRRVSAFLKVAGSLVNSKVPAHSG